MVAPIFVWGKYGCSSTCYWVSMDLQNASAGQINGYGALCRHKPTVTLGSSGCDADCQQRMNGCHELNAYVRVKK
ncbi:hypothetical protein E3N88_35628 [Mikania micrantha]|uniref:Uncharacterized protein n=1 Tax=Mikania micrantha TaxID=192012 RepID=A0A5N6M1T0_9ASTR|nr:hypothetical protein E3N88_35628 [Mikania micrantha]